MNKSTRVWAIVGAIAGVIGALSWLPHLLQHYEQPEVHGRFLGGIVSLSQEFSTPNPFTGERISVSGVGYRLNFALVSLRRDLPIKSCSVCVRYEGESTAHMRPLHVAHVSSVTLPGGRKYVRIPPEEDLALTVILEKDKVSVRRAFFVVPEASDARAMDFELIELIFYDYRNRQYSFAVRTGDIDPGSLYFDKSILYDEP